MLKVQRRERPRGGAGCTRDSDQGPGRALGVSACLRVRSTRPSPHAAAGPVSPSSGLREISPRPGDQPRAASVAPISVSGRAAPQPGVWSSPASPAQGQAQVSSQRLRHRSPGSSATKGCAAEDGVLGVRSSPGAPASFLTPASRDPSQPGGGVVPSQGPPGLGATGGGLRAQCAQCGSGCKGRNGGELRAGTDGGRSRPLHLGVAAWPARPFPEHDSARVALLRCL